MAAIRPYPPRLSVIASAETPPAERRPRRSDEEILAGVRRGAQEVAEDFYWRVKPVVERTVRRLLGRLDRDGEDLVQIALVQLIESVTAYRRSMSPFPVRELVVPLLSRADNDGPSAFEVLVESDRDGGVRRHASLVAEDAGTVRVGDAAGPSRSR